MKEQGLPSSGPEDAGADLDLDLDLDSDLCSSGPVDAGADLDTAFPPPSPRSTAGGLPRAAGPWAGERGGSYEAPSDPWTFRISQE